MNTRKASAAIQDSLPEIRLPVIKVLGLGGGGSNAINRMIELGLTGVEYIAANTDSQALNDSLAQTKLQLGPSLTRGLGAGGNPAVGEGAAEESEDEIRQVLKGADMVFVTAGMGGGTGTGAIPVAARISRELGAVTIGIVTLPFSFEIGRRQLNAQEGMRKLSQHTDTLITVPNDRLLKIASRDLPLELAFRLADDVLRQGIQGITQLVTQPGMINVDFSHVRNMMQSGGGALLAIGYGQGKNRALQSVKQALNHPLLEATPLEQASGIIANFTGGEDIAFVEIAEALTFLHKHTNEDTEVIPGINTNPNMKNKVEVILIITGLENKKDRRVEYESKEYYPAAQPALPSHEVSMQEEEPALEFVGSLADFDVPTFIRRKTRI